MVTGEELERLEAEVAEAERRASSGPADVSASYEVRRAARDALARKASRAPEHVAPPRRPVVRPPAARPAEDEVQRAAQLRALGAEVQRLEAAQAELRRSRGGGGFVAVSREQDTGNVQRQERPRAASRPAGPASPMDLFIALGRPRPGWRS